MARDIYELTDESRLVLSHDPQGIAREMGKHQSYIYDFLELRSTDIFAKFLPVYNASVRAGAPVCHWDNTLAASRSRYAKFAPAKNVLECLRDKLSTQNEMILKIYEAISDGQLDEHEIRTIQGLIEKETEDLTRLNTQLTFQLGVLSKGKGA